MQIALQKCVIKDSCSHYPSFLCLTNLFVLRSFIVRIPFSTSILEFAPDTNWRLPAGVTDLEIALPDVAADITAGVVNQLSDVLMVRHQGKIRHWAYGSLLWDDLFPLVMFEHEQVVAIVEGDDASG